MSGRLRARLEAALNRRWYPTGEPGERTLTGRALWLLLTPLEWAFGAIVALRRYAYARTWLPCQRARVPVVVVGNISVGGTGKTPFTIYLAKCLREDLGLRAGIVTRGYGAGRSAGDRPVRVSAHSDPAQVGDEAVLLATQTGVPVVAGRDRVAAVRMLEREVDVLLADDGLQHLRLARDLEIVLIDEQRGLGNGRLLPCGPLREAPSRLSSADLLVLTGARADQEAPSAVSSHLPSPSALTPAPVTLRARACSSTSYAVASPTQVRSLESFAGTRVHAVAGIADPRRFFSLLRASGLELIEHPLEDHAPLYAHTLAFDDDFPVLMTEKDAVKCRSFADARCWAVRLDVQMAPADRRTLVAAVDALCSEGAPNGS